MVGLEELCLARRLDSLRDELPEDVRTDPYLVAALGPPVLPDGELAIRRYWMDEARSAEAQGDHALAYQHYYHAGWDYYVHDDIDDVLAALVRSAEAAGFDALHRIALHHRASMP